MLKRSASGVQTRSRFAELAQSYNVSIGDDFPAREASSVRAVTLTRVALPITCIATTSWTCSLTFFGQLCVIREWGSLGNTGGMRTVSVPAPIEAEAALERQRRARERRGYA